MTKPYMIGFMESHHYKPTTIGLMKAKHSALRLSASGER